MSSFAQGVSAPHIQDVRGMTKSICVSSLLAKAPEAQHFIATGGETPFGSACSRWLRLCHHYVASKCAGSDACSAVYLDSTQPSNAELLAARQSQGSCSQTHLYFADMHASLHLPQT